MIGRGKLSFLIIIYSCFIWHFVLCYFYDYFNISFKKQNTLLASFNKQLLKVFLLAEILIIKYLFVSFSYKIFKVTCFDLNIFVLVATKLKVQK